MCGLMNSSYVAFCSVSGIVSMITSAHLAASAMSITVEPGGLGLGRRLAALAQTDDDRARRDSLRFSAWA